MLAACLFAAGTAAAEKVALTFDDLPLNGALPAGTTRSAITRETLAVLKRLDVPPSYGFVNARKLEGSPDGALALRLWVDAGHPVGNHAYSHMDLHKNSAEDYTRDIVQNEPALELLSTRDGTVSDSWRWFRYPFLREGETLDKRRAVRAFLAQRGYRIAQTTLDYEDYLWNTAYARCLDRGDKEAMAWLRESYLEMATAYLKSGRETARMVFGREISHVLLLHLGAFSSTILPDLVALLRKEGFQLTTLEDAQSDPVYALDPDVASKWGGTLTELFMEARSLKYTYPKKPREKLEGICKAT
ncbi:hypothetical protein BWI17_15785 [Betaproteobacteria bacterium GR16-43]|nr:hypothetical protein BWI17_15785 [Betaproteobacteria bacterium GR16-43]